MTSRPPHPPHEPPYRPAADRPTDAPVAAGPAPAGPPPGAPSGPPWGPQPVATQPAHRPGSFRRGFGWGAGVSLGAGLVLAAVGTVATLLGTIALVGLVGAAAGAGSVDEPVTTTVWGEDDAAHRLVSVEVTGVILGDASDGGAFVGGTYGYEVADVIDGLDAEDADGLVLELNTPGGTIYGSKAIADAVERYQERTGNAVLAYVRGTSASGGVYAMSGADEVVADHGTLVGSIGVIMGPFDRYRDVTGIPGSLLEPGVETQGGVTQEYLSKGKGKDLGNPYRDMTAEERAVLDAGLESEYTQFVDWVSQARGIPAQTIRDELGAYVFDPRTAVENGLVDDVMNRDEAFRRAAELNDVDPDDTRVDRVASDDFLTLLLGASADPGAAQDAGPSTGARPGVLCTGTPIVLALHGDLAAVCRG
ncbi:S49 family peptidase [Thalassiella azotivora]